MAKRESYGPQRSPFQIVLYILVVVLLLGGIAYLVKCTRVKQNDFQKQLQEMGAQETEYVQVKQTVTEAESEAGVSTEQTTATEKDAAVTESAGAQETESETNKADAAVKSRHILVLNGSGKDGMAARWQAELQKDGYTNVSVASFPGSAVDRTRIYVEKEEDAKDLTELFQAADVTTDAFTAEITLTDGSAPKDVDVYIIIGKNDAVE